MCTALPVEVRASDPPAGTAEVVSHFADAGNQTRSQQEQQVL